MSNPFDIEANNINKSKLVRSQISAMKILESQIAIMHGIDIKAYRSTLRQVARAMGVEFATRTTADKVLWIKRTR
jgi:hypothetical protein